MNVGDHTWQVPPELNSPEALKAIRQEFWTYDRLLERLILKRLAPKKSLGMTCSQCSGSEIAQTSPNSSSVKRFQCCRCRYFWFPTSEGETFA